MINHHDVLLKCRNQLLTTQAATTGSTTLVATENGFTRSAGDFVADGFVSGMEVKPAGFTDNSAGLISTVTSTTITLRGTRAAQPSGSGRTLSVEIPELRGWSNLEVDPITDRWYIEEEYLPGPSRQTSVGTLGDMDHLPVYLTRLFSPQNIGVSALSKLADAILDTFAPRYAMTLADGNILRVRSNPGPERSQVLRDDDGFAYTLVTIPLWGRTRNII